LSTLIELHKLPHLLKLRRKLKTLSLRLRLRLRRCGARLLWRRRSGDVLHMD
jgi:hypothetical protein